VSAANIVDAAAAHADAPLAVASAVLPARYRLAERLGAGAAGETFAAVDQSTGAACVVKIFAPDDGARRLALSELRGLETLIHPNLARLRDLGRCEDGRLFLVTDRIVGPGLDSVAAIADPVRRRAVFEAVALDLASALAHLHARGIVHGDVCPANVRLSSDGAAGPRAVLIDFGLAGPPVATGNGARGTLGYAAPEALTGARTPAVDLFALGATLFEAWSGTSPFGLGLPAVQRMLEGRAPTLSSIRPGLDGGWDRLLDRLVAPDAAERPGSAREILREIRRLSSGSATPTEVDLAVPYPEGDPLAGIVVGRRSERAALRAAFDKLSDGMAPASTLVLVGAVGSGRRTLFEVGAREVSMAAAAGTTATIEIWRGDLDALERSVGLGAISSGDDAQRAAEVRMAALAEALEGAARERPLCVFLEEGAAAQLFAAFVAGAPPTGRVLVVVPSTAPIDRPFATSLVLAPLTASELGELIRAGVEVPPPPAVLEELAQIARGNVALAVALARRLIADLRTGLDARAVLEPGADLEELLRRSFTALPDGAQRLVLAVALAGSDAASVAALEDDAAARASVAARAAGWIDFDPPGAARLSSGAHHEVALSAAPPALARAIAVEALRVLAADDPRRADALVIAGRAGEAAEILRRGAALARQQGAGPRAAALLERAISLASGAVDLDERLALATGLAILGRYDEAERALVEARDRAGDPREAAAVCERQGWLRARRGDVEGARTVLEGGLAESAAAGLPAVDLRARLARLLITAGRFREARAIVEPLLEDGTFVDAHTGAGALCVESALLAGAYLGDLPQARQRLAQLAGLPEASPTRLAYLEGLLAQLGGDEHLAREAYRRAYESGSRQGDVHTVAAVALNLGGLLTEEGLFGEALTACARAVRELGRLGATAELVPALVNAANLFVELGDLPAARRALERAQGLSGPGAPTRAAATASFVQGDLARRAGQRDAAAR
jgi:tetratricopeptide (TPR) repeat protein